MIFRDVAEKARTFTKHDMIDEYSELPPYPEHRARLVYWFLARAGRPQWQDVVALAVSLAQFGLETHDLVDEPARNETLRNVRRRQLQVLAGDYFNGRFYELLAHAGGVEMVRLVSRAICEVSRLKAVLYEKWHGLRMTAEEYLHHLVLIRSELFMPLTDYMAAGDAERFPALFRSLVRCEILRDELEAGTRGQFRRGYAFWHMLQHGTPAERETLLEDRGGSFAVLLGKYNVTAQLERMLEAQMQTVRRLAESFGSESLLAEIGRILDALAVRMPAMNTAEDL